MWMCLLAHAEEGAGFSFPPLHPIFVNLTAGLVPISLLCDALGAWWKKDSLRAAGWWTLLFAAVFTPATVLFGWLWMHSMGSEGLWEMGYHKWLGTGIGVGLIPLAVWRGLLWRRGRGPNWLYAAAGAVLFAALLIQGDLGGAMSFGRGIVIGTTHSKESVFQGAHGGSHGSDH